MSPLLSCVFCWFFFKKLNFSRFKEKESLSIVKFFLFKKSICFTEIYFVKKCDSSLFKENSRIPFLSCNFFWRKGMFVPFKEKNMADSIRRFFSFGEGQIKESLAIVSFFWFFQEIGFYPYIHIIHIYIYIHLSHTERIWVNSRSPFIVMILFVRSGLYGVSGEFFFVRIVFREKFSFLERNMDTLQESLFTVYFVFWRGTNVRRLPQWVYSSRSWIQVSVGARE